MGWQQLGLPGRRSPRSTVNSLEEAEEEVNNPAGGARGGCSKIILNSNICVMIGGRVAMGKKPLTSRCRPDEVKTSFDCCTLIDHFHFPVVFFICAFVFFLQCLIRIR